MGRKSTGEYPSNWKAIATAIKDEHGWKCIRCGHPHDPASGYTLTVHHADMCPPNCAWYNLLCLCQKCHLQVQAKVIMERPWLYEHSEWFRPFAGGYFAHKYLGQDLTREEVMANLDYYAGLEVSVLQEAI